MSTFGWILLLIWAVAFAFTVGLVVGESDRPAQPPVPRPVDWDAEFARLDDDGRIRA